MEYSFCDIIKNTMSIFFQIQQLAIHKTEMFERIENLKDDKGLFTFYKQLEEQETRFSTLGSPAHSNSQYSVSSIQPKKNIYQNKTKKSYNTSNKQNQSFFEKQDTEHQRYQQLPKIYHAQKFLQKCIINTKKKQNQETQQSVFHSIPQKINEDKERKTLAHTSRPQRQGTIKRQQPQVSFENYTPSVHRVNYSLQLPQSLTKKFQTLASQRKKQIAIHYRNKIPVNLRDSKKENQPKYIKSQRQKKSIPKRNMIEELKLPQIPKSLIIGKRKKKINLKYLQKSQSYPLLSILDLKPLEIQSNFSKGLPIQINMNHLFPIQTIEGWSQRKKQLLNKILHKI